MEPDKVLSPKSRWSSEESLLSRAVIADRPNLKGQDSNRIEECLLYDLLNDTVSNEFRMRQKRSDLGGMEWGFGCRAP
jgi:hypothetical protein